MMYKINLFQQQLTTLTGLVYNMRSTSANNNLGPVLQQMNQMNLRLAALEETCREIISALGVKPASAIEEDEEYRPA